MTLFRPQLQSIYEQWKNHTLNEYLEKHILHSKPVMPLNKGAHDEVQGIFLDLIEKYNGKNVVKIVEENEIELKLMNTADHIGMLHYDFPLMLGANIISNLRYILSNDIDNMIPSLTFSSIPFSNATLPGTINPSNISSPKDKSVKLKPIKVKGKSKTLPLYSQKISKEVILNEIKFYERILDDVNPHFSFLNKEKVKILVDLIKTISNHGETFNEQAISLSYKAWFNLFNFKVGPQLLIPIEDLSKSLTKQSISMNLLEFSSIREAMIKNFRNVYGAFVLNEDGKIQQGTYFYWEIDDNNRRIPMKIEGEYLKSISSDFIIHVSEIPEYLSQNKIDESLSIIFFNTCFFPGVKPIGGFNQVEYLHDQKFAWIKTFRESGFKEHANKLENFRTDLYNTGPLIIYNSDGSPKTGSQVIIEGGLNISYLKKLGNTNFGKLLGSAKPIIDSLIGGKKPDHSRILEILKNYRLNYLINERLS